MGQSSRPHVASASVWCSTELEVLDDVALCMTFFLIQVANGFLAVVRSGWRSMAR